MAKVNTKVLTVVDASGAGDELMRPLTKNAGPPLAMLQSRARALGAFRLDDMIGKFNPENITLKQRKLMRRDPMIKLGLHYRKVPLINAPRRVECDDPQIKAFVEKNLERHFTRITVQMLLAYDWGYQPIVKMFKPEIPTDWTYEDPVNHELKDVWPEKNIPAVVWDDFQALPPLGAEVVFTKDGQKFNGFKHQSFSPTLDGSGGPLIVPPEYALWVTNERDESYGDWYGYPITGYVYRYWWSYWYRFLLADRHFEQDADPPLKIEYPPGSGPDPDDPNSEVDNYVIALKVGVNLRDGATIALPSDYYESPEGDRIARGAKKWDAEFLRGGENMKAFQESFDYLDVLKLRGLMIPEQAILPVTSGGGSLVTGLGDLLTESLTIDLNWLLSIWNDDLIPQLVEQNFVDAPPCKIVVENLREEDMGKLNELIGVIASQDPAALTVDWREAAKQAGLPLQSQEQIEAAKEEAKQAAADQMEQMQKQQALKEQGNGADSTASGKKPTGAHSDRPAGTTQDKQPRRKNANPGGATG